MTIMLDRVPEAASLVVDYDGTKIVTTRGLLNVKLLARRCGVIANADLQTDWVEYWLAGELVHRSVHVFVKQPLIGKSQS